MAGTFFGWRVVAVAFSVAVFAYGIAVYGPGVWLHALALERGWSVAFVSACITLHFLAGATVAARLPALHARLGIAATTRLGLVVLAVGCAGWALAAAPWHLPPAALLTGAAFGTMGGPAINAMVSPWFDRRRPAALAMAYNGASVGGAVFVPLWAALIGSLGFGPAALLVGGAGVVLLWSVVGRYLGLRPADLGLHPDGGATPPAPRAPAKPAGPLWPQAPFRSLALAFAAGTAAQVGLFSQLFSLAAPALGPQGAGWALGAASACAVLGRTAVGWLLKPDTDRRRVAALNFLIQAGGSLALLLSAAGAAPAPPVLVMGCVLFGLGVGNMLSLPPMVAQVEWPPEQVAAVVAAIGGTMLLAGAFAPAIFGLLRDGFGDWAAVGTALTLQLTAALLVQGTAGARPSS
jgi:MFS family permease